ISRPPTPEDLFGHPVITARPQTSLAPARELHPRNPGVRQVPDCKLWSYSEHLRCGPDRVSGGHVQAWERPELLQRVLGRRTRSFLGNHGVCYPRRAKSRQICSATRVRERYSASRQGTRDSTASAVAIRAASARAWVAPYITRHAASIPAAVRRSASASPNVSRALELAACSNVVDAQT